MTVIIDSKLIIHELEEFSVMLIQNTLTCLITPCKGKISSVGDALSKSDITYKKLGKTFELKIRSISVFNY